MSRLDRYFARRGGRAEVLVSWACMAGAVLCAVLAVLLRQAAFGWAAALLTIALCIRRYFRGHF